MIKFFFFISANNFCAANPCEHGGRCHSDALGYRCECVPGYTGDNCNKREYLFLRH
jgi:hypothetical protein